MPHLKLEYSSNLQGTFSAQELFAACHKVLVDTVQANLARCQSRAISYDIFHVANGDPNNAFLHLEVLLLEGRTPTQLQKLQESLQKVLKHHCQSSLLKCHVRTSLRIVELPLSRYTLFDTY
ncbi:MAG: hypothetical protein FJZ63_04505 [Chlamydiae bacterium]|nr:hypothetical protein [Chlamydiota bacterium]